ncbi:hypothetical protein M5K25_018848 [Dendrobium thyrsiflorum]|uniref:Uncharacterized protein n=1 Tax=Dendrobium thyrsiflorum TaxID=117978 RepID=A0ABD0UDH8_DENTH
MGAWAKVHAYQQAAGWVMCSYLRANQGVSGSLLVPDYVHCLDRGRIACTKISEFVRRNLQSLAREGLAKAT